MVWFDSVGATALSAGLAMLGGAVATAYAQAVIGSGAMGVIAEKPEEGSKLLIYIALPETILILAFVIAFLLTGKLDHVAAAVPAGNETVA